MGRKKKMREPKDVFVDISASDISCIPGDTLVFDDGLRLAVISDYGESTFCYSCHAYKEYLRICHKVPCIKYKFHLEKITT